MAKGRSNGGKKAAPATYTLTLDKRQAKAVLTILRAIEMRMFEKGFELKPAQMKLVQELRQQLTRELGESDSSLEEQLAAAVEWEQSRRKKPAPPATGSTSEPDTE